MLKKLICFKAVLVILLLLGSNPVLSQTLRTDPLQLYIDKDKINAANLSKVISNISFVYRVPVGFEMKTDKAKDKNLSKKSPLLSRSGSLKEVLNEITKIDNAYDWELKNGVINIFPVQDKDYLVKEILNTKINEVKFEFTKDGADVGKSIFELPAIKDKLTSFGVTAIQIRNISGLTYGTLEELESDVNAYKTFINSKDTSVKAILNDLLTEHKFRYWTILRWGENQEFITLVTR